MANAGNLLFGNLPWFPVSWIIGLLAFIALWWYCCRDLRSIRRLFLVLWLPAALVAAATYGIDGHGRAVSDVLHHLIQADPAELHLLLRWPSNGFAATYAVVVGGFVAALATMALQLAGVVLGALLALTPAGGRDRPRR
jgi:hypothetical protein